MKKSMKYVFSLVIAVMFLLGLFPAIMVAAESPTTYQLTLPEGVIAWIGSKNTPITEAEAGKTVSLYLDCPEDKGFRKIEASGDVELMSGGDYYYFTMPEEDVTITVTYAEPIKEAALTTTGFAEGLELSDVELHLPEDAPFELLSWTLANSDTESREGEIVSDVLYTCAVFLAPKDGYGFSLDFLMNDESVGFYPGFTLDGISAGWCGPATLMDFNEEGAIALAFHRFAPSSKTVEQTDAVLENYSYGTKAGDLTITFDPIFDDFTKYYWLSEVWDTPDSGNSLSDSNELVAHKQYYLCVSIDSNPLSEIDILGMEWDALLVNGLSPVYTFTGGYSGGGCVRFIYELPELHWYEQQYDENNHWLECIYGECGEIIEPEAHSFSDEYISDGNVHYHECECGARADEDSCYAGSEYDWDDENHWYPCETCGYKHDEWLHGDDGSGWQDGDGYHWQNCSCGYKLYYAEHGYSNWQDDGTEHYKYCEECYHEIERGTHDYQTGYDDNQHYTRCTVCEFDEPGTYPENHTITWHVDGEYHWQECDDGCGYKTEQAKHNFKYKYDDSTDENVHWQECECGEKLEAEAHSYPESYRNDGTHHWHECKCGKEIDKDQCYGTTYHWSPEEHWLPCDVCGYETEKSAHEEDMNGWYTDDDSEHYKICSSCSAKYNEAEHTYGEWQGGGEDEHYRTCSECFKEVDRDSHSYANKYNDDFHWKECECGDIIDNGTHEIVNDDWKHDEKSHWLQCTGCDYMKSKEDHDFDYVYDDSTDVNVHWQECECGAILAGSEASHSYGAYESDSVNHWQTCVCGKIIGDSHDFGEYKMTDDEHYKTCVCGEETDRGYHDDMNEDNACDICNFDMTVVHAHDYGTTWKTDKDNHWKECACGDKTDIASHTDSNSDNKCDTCDYDIPVPTYTVTLPESDGFTVVPESGCTTIVPAGGDFSFTIEIAEGYAENNDFEVRVNGVDLEDEDGVYTIENITADQVIEVDGIVKSDTYVSGVLMKPGDYLAVGASATTKEKPAGGYAYLENYGTLVLHNYSTSAGYEIIGGLVSICSTDPNLSIYLEGENSLTPAGEMTGGILAMDRIYLHGDSDSSLTINTDSFAIQSSGDIYFWGGVYRFNSGIGSGGCIDIDSDSDISISAPVLGITAEDVYVYEGSLKITDCQTAISANSIAVYSGYVDICSAATGADDDTYYAVSVEPHIESILRVMASTSADGELGVYDPAEYKSYDRIVIISPGAVVGDVPLFDGEYVAVGSSTATLTKPEGAGYAHYSEGVLTLNNYSYTGAGYEYDYYAVVYTIGDVEIVLVGTNTLTQTEKDSEAILGNGDTIISGDGKLVCDAEYAINCLGELTVNGGEITINNTIFGIYAEYVIINGGNLTVKTIESYSDVVGISVDESIDINGGSITINSIYYGMFAEDDITISGGTVVIVAETGIYAYNTIIKGGNITIDADRFAIRAMNTMLFKGGVLDARSNNIAADGDYWAISVAPVLDGTGITIQASADRNGGLGAYDPLAIQTYDHVVIYVAHTCSGGIKQSGQAASCSVAGWKDYYKCGSCEKLYTDAACTTEIIDLATWKTGDGKIATLDHTPEADDGDCTTAIKCSVCETVTTEAKANHTGGTATCTSKAKCSECNKEYGDFAAHTPDADDGDCTTAIKCSVCEAITTEAKANHTGGTATCTSKAKCSVCNKEYGTTLDHDYADQWTTNASKHWKECSCGAKSEEADHNPDRPSATEEDPIKCTVCDYIITPALGHVHNHNTQKYDENNHWMECECGDKKDVTAHTEQTVEGTDATCTESGLTEGKRCTVCGITTVAQKTIEALGHTEVTVLGKEATCTEAGLTDGKKCSVCDVIILAQSPIQALGHTYDDANDETCNRCDYVRDVACTHTETETIPGTPATCTATGLSNGVKCKACEEIVTAQETIPALGHSEEPLEAKDATCTEAGLTAGKKCSVCGEILVAQNPVAALGHTEEAVKGTPATCTESGLTDGKKCSVCDVVLVAQETIPALGHSLIKVDGKAATCTVDGYKAHYKCTVCEVLYADEAGTDEIFDLETWQTYEGYIEAAHTFGEWQEEIPATTESAGTKAHYHCSVCEKNFDEDGYEIADLSIPKLEETPDPEETTPAPEETTPAPEETTPAPEETTPVPEETTPVPEETTPTPEETTPDAQPEQPTEEEPKAGLSGGAVAGIVVASTVAVGAGGFSIFWFVVQKKSATELVTVTKALCKQVGGKIKDVTLNLVEKIKKLFAKK